MDNRIRFTKTALDALPPAPAGARVAYYDTQTPGLVLRVTATGVKTFSVFRRVKGGPMERITLGRFPDLPLEAARERALGTVATLAKGESAAGQVRRQRAQQVTLAEAFKDYLESKKDLKPSTVADMRYEIESVFADWLKHPLVKITPRMVIARHKAHGERSPARANLAMRYLRALFNFAMSRYRDGNDAPILASNPVSALSAEGGWYRVERRQTVIKAQDLGPWIRAVANLPSPHHRDLLLFVLMTGIRRGEVQTLRWEHVDVQARTITLVDTKNHQDHTLPLSDFLFDLLAQRKGEAVSGLVFADERGRPVSNLRYAQARIQADTGLTFCLHDLRRTFATVAESLDLPAYAIKRLLNHANGADVTAGYIVPNPERLREPMQKITDYMLKAGGLKPTAPVVELHPQAREARQP